MKISARDKDIIARCGLHADESLARLAKRSKHQLHTVRQAFDRLRKAEIIARVNMIDIFQLGLTRYQIFFASAIHSTSAKSKLLSFLTSAPQVSFIAEMGGDYDYEVLFLGRNSSEVIQLLEECTKRCGAIAVNKSVIIHESVSFFPRKYLALSNPVIEEITFNQINYAYRQLSPIDYKILQALGTTPEITKLELAKQNGVVVATIDAHMKRLTAQKILKGAIFSVNANLFGGQYFVILVHSRGFDPTFAKNLHDFARRHPNCTNFRRCFGSWDFELGIEVLSHHDILQFKESPYRKFEIHITTLRVLSRLKVHKYVVYPQRLSAKE